MVAPPKVVSIEEDHMLSSDAMLNELQSLCQHLTSAYQTLGRALAQLSASNAHCTTIRRELDHVHQQLQNAMKKKERGSKKIKARFLTSRDLRAEFEQEDAERQEQEHVTAEKNKQKEAMNAESARRVADDAANRAFSGRISSYKKDDLRALALALGLSDEGGKKDLTTWIEEKFASEPDLKKNMRFLGLFDKSRTHCCHGQTPAANVKSDLEPKGAESDLDGNEETNKPQARIHGVPTQPLASHSSLAVHTLARPAPAMQSTQPVLPSRFHPQHPYPPHPPLNYPPYQSLNHLPFTQSSHLHPQQQYQFQFYKPSV
jgi:hypothetical protein